MFLISERSDLYSATDDQPVSCRCEDALKVLQVTYCRRLLGQVGDIEKEVAMLSSESNWEEASVALCQILKSTASTASTFSLARLSEIASLMLALLREWGNAGHSPAHDDVRVFRKRLQDLAHQASRVLILCDEQVEAAGDDADAEIRSEEPGAEPVSDSGRSADNAGDRLRQYQQLVATSKDMLAMIDRNYRYVITNHSYASQLGTSVSQLVGLSAAEVLGDRVFEQLLKPRIDQALAGESVRFEAWIGLSAGASRFMDVIYEPYSDAGGEVSGMVVSARDITDRKQVEDRLRDSELRFRQLADNIPQVFLLCDPREDRVRYASPSYEAVWGRSCESLYQNPHSMLEDIHPEDLERVRRTFAARSNGTPVSLEFRLLSSDGREQTISYRGFPVFDDQQELQATAAIAEDITATRGARDAVEASESRFRTLTELSPTGVFRNDSSGSAVYVNNQAALLLGISRQACLGYGWTAALHPDDAPRIGALWNACVASRRPFRESCRFLHADGKEVRVICHSVPEFGPQGEFRGYIGALTDVTDLKRPEA